MKNNSTSTNTHIHSTSLEVTVERRACQGLKQECAMNAICPDQLCYRHGPEERTMQFHQVLSKTLRGRKIKNQKEEVFTDLIFLGLA